MEIFTQVLLWDCTKIYVYIYLSGYKNIVVIDLIWQIVAKYEARSTILGTVVGGVAPGNSTTIVRSYVGEGGGRSNAGAYSNA